MRNLLAVTFIATFSMSASTNADPITLLGSDDFVWETTPEGVAFAPLQGDRFVESYQAMVRLPAGTISPLHVKSANMYGVVLQGAMTHYLDDHDPDAARRMEPGSFYRIASDTPHVSACVSDEPCVAYLFQDGAFDFLPVQQ